MSKEADNAVKLMQGASSQTMRLVAACLSDYIMPDSSADSATKRQRSIVVSVGDGNDVTVHTGDAPQTKETVAVAVADVLPIGSTKRTDANAVKLLDDVRAIVAACIVATTADNTRKNK